MASARSRRLIGCLVALLGLLPAACSSDDGDATSAPATTEPTTSSTDAETTSTTGAPADVCDPEAPDAPFGLWPESTWSEACLSVPRLESGADPWRSDPSETARQFAREVLGWDDPAIVEVSPISEYGRASAVVQPAGRDTEIHANLSRHLNGRWWVVTSVWTLPDEHPPSYSLVGSNLEVRIRPMDRPEVEVYQGGRSVIVQVVESTTAFEAILDRDPAAPSAFLVRWLDNGLVVAVAGEAMPAGDSAAG